MNLATTIYSPGAMVVPAIDWLNQNLHPLFSLISSAVGSILNVLETILLALPDYALIMVVTVVVAFVLNFRIAIFCALALGFLVLTALWTAAMQTVALVLVSVVIAVLLAFPLGVLAAHNRRFEGVLRPVLDIMQTVPPWVYLIPAVIFFGTGRTPALMATIVYGTPPMLRLTTLAFKQVPRELLELGLALGASKRTILLKIEMPAAKPTILLGLNQCILLSLSMVVLAGLVGAGGLGSEVTRGLTRMEMGLGLRAGLGIVAVALLLDRLSHAALQVKRKI